VRVEALELPAAAEAAPRLAPRPVDAPALEPRDRPVGRRPLAGRRGEPRPADVGQEEQVIHHLPVLEGFGLDAVHDSEVDRLLGRGRGSGAEHERERET